MNVPLSGPAVSREDIEAVVRVLESPVLSIGPKVEAFERSICDYTGAKYATAVNSGTSALHLAVRALDIGPGDEVITTPFSFVASANCMLFEQARPVFVDIDPSSFNIDTSQLDGAVTERTRAILPVHVFGRPADMDRVREVAVRHRLKIIEDSCEALGATWRSEHVGTIGDVGAFAFYPNKQITTGEGGMLVTNSPELDGLFKSLRNQGRGTSGGWLQHERLGYNYRMSEINAVLGHSQMSRVRDILGRRTNVAELYRHHLAGMEEIELPVYELPHATLSWFVYVIRLRIPGRDAVLDSLRAQGVACSNYFSPIHLQPYFRQMGYSEGQFPITEGVANSTIALPFFTNLSEPEVAHVSGALKTAIEQVRPLTVGGTKRFDQ